MFSKKSQEVLRALNSTHRLVQSATNIWYTLVLPLGIAVIVTYLLGVEDFGKLSTLNWVMIGTVCITIIIIHVFAVSASIAASNTDTMLPEYNDIKQKLVEIEQEFKSIKELYDADSVTYTSQMDALRVTSEALSYAIGKIRNQETAHTKVTNDTMDEMIHSLLWPLVVFRERLFNFPQGSLWNIALYVLNKEGKLVPKWRMNDKRIQVQNRAWDPGFGVVGLSFLHKTIKYLGDDVEDQAFSKNSDHDKETYKSIIAVPVIPCEDKSSQTNHLPVGVLVLTSDQSLQFNLDRDAKFLQTHANLVAILIEKYRTYTEHVAEIMEKPTVDSGDQRPKDPEDSCDENKE